MPALPLLADAQPDLASIALTDADVPEGLSRDRLDNGAAELDAILLPEGVVASGDISDSFVAGHQSAFFGRPRDGGGEEVRMASAVILFDRAEAASGALDLLAHSPGALRRLRTIGAVQHPTRGLGDESYGRSLRSAHAEIFTHLWRNGRLVVVLAAGGGVGAVRPEVALGLARTVDARIPTALDG